MIRKKKSLVLSLILFLGTIFLLGFFVFSIARSPKQSLFLENRCLSGGEKPIVSSNQFQPKGPLQGWTRYQQSAFGFLFDVPGDQWQATKNIIQEFEEPLVFPKMEYSLYFSHPVGSCNSLHWEEGEKAELHFMVFNNYCQSLEEWLSFIPGSEKVKQEEIEINGVKGIKLQNLRGYQADELIIFNHDRYHYQFRLKVRYPEDLPFYSEELDQIVATLIFLPPEETNEKKIE
jgi:hypothetical protein